GRYDTLLETISDGSVSLPATGFAMGDYVIRNLIEETPHAELNMAAWLQLNTRACDVYLVLADPSKRPDALRILADLRNAGISCDLPFAPAKINKQFQNAERSGARFALVIGSELPELKLKVLSSRAEESCHALGLA